MKEALSTEVTPRLQEELSIMRVSLCDAPEGRER